jgi:hypothetical protein
MKPGIGVVLCVSHLMGVKDVRRRCMCSYSWKYNVKLSQLEIVGEADDATQ